MFYSDAGTYTILLIFKRYNISKYVSKIIKVVGRNNSMEVLLMSDIVLIVYNIIHYLRLIDWNMILLGLSTLRLVILTQQQPGTTCSNC